MRKASQQEEEKNCEGRVSNLEIAKKRLSESPNFFISQYQESKR